MKDLRLELIIKVLRAKGDKIVALTQFIDKVSYVTTIFRIKDLKSLSEEKLLSVTKDLVSYSISGL